MPMAMQCQGSTQSAPAAGSTFSCSVLFFARVPPMVPYEELHQLFSRFGTVKVLNLYKPWATAKSSKGCGTVRYSSAEEAHAAMTALHKVHRFRAFERFEDEAVMVVEWADPSKLRPKHAVGEDVVAGQRARLCRTHGTPAGKSPWLTGNSSRKTDSLPGPDDALGKCSMLKQLQLDTAACQTGSTSSGPAHLKPLHAADLCPGPVYTRDTVLHQLGTWSTSNPAHLLPFLDHKVSGSSTCASAYVHSRQEQQELPSVVSAMPLPGDNRASGSAACGTFAGMCHNGSTSGWMQLLSGKTAGSFSSCTSHSSSSSSSSLNGSTLQQPSCGEAQNSDGTLHPLSMLGPLSLQPLPQKQAAGLHPGVELGGPCIPTPPPSLLLTSVLSSSGAVSGSGAHLTSPQPAPGELCCPAWPFTSSTGVSGSCSSSVGPMTAAGGYLLPAGVASACVSRLLPGQVARPAPAYSEGLAVTAPIIGISPMLTAADQRSPQICCSSSGDSSFSGHYMTHACSKTHELGPQANSQPGSLRTDHVVVEAAVDATALGQIGEQAPLVSKITGVQVQLVAGPSGMQVRLQGSAEQVTTASQLLVVTPATV